MLTDKVMQLLVAFINVIIWDAWPRSGVLFIGRELLLILNILMIKFKSTLLSHNLISFR